MRIQAWRVAFLLAGATMFAGGPRHPSPDTGQPFEAALAGMLAHPAWVPSHLGLLAGYASLLLGLWLWSRDGGHAGLSRGWMRFVLIAAVLAVVEMAIHTAAVVDLERLRAGAATPVLTTHIVLTGVVNPLIGGALAVVAVLAGRARSLGSPWVSWTAALGGPMYGFASVYVVVTHDQRVSPLFAIGSILIALWLLLIAVWPTRAARAERRGEFATADAA